ncbi:MAG TPA: hypothetical protein VIK57_07540 [Streptosporangiaceae bacterium]
MSTELEQRLRGAMERFTDDVRVPPGLAARADQHRRARRARTRAVTAAGTVAVMAAGGLAVAGVTGAFGSASPRPVQTTYTAYVVRHVERALASSRVGSLLEQDRTVFAAGNSLEPVPTGLIGSAHGSGGRSFWPVSSSLNWSYRGTAKFSAFTAGGQRVFDVRMTSAHQTLSSTAVFYRNHTWWTSTPDIRLSGGNGGPSGCVRGHEIVLRKGQGNGWPGFIRSQLACGAYTVVGRQVVGGVDAIKITGASGTFVFWVNPATYLPVQMALPQQRTQFQWLSPTPANLAQLKVTVPAGFTQVQPPAVQRH